MRAARWLPLVAIIGFALPATASACSCARLPEAERFKDADAAFTGRLVSRHALDPDPDGVESSGDPFVHRYRLDRRYKGRLFRTVWVRTVRGEATCGVPTRRRIALLPHAGARTLGGRPVWRDHPARDAQGRPRGPRRRGDRVPRLAAS